MAREKVNDLNETGKRLIAVDQEEIQLLQRFRAFDSKHKQKLVDYADRLDCLVNLSTADKLMARNTLKDIGVNPDELGSVYLNE